MYNGYNVTDIQTKLLNSGFDPGGIDGVYGGKTTAAVKAYQQAKGLTADGIVGNNTWGSLAGASPSPSPPHSGNMATINTATPTPAGFNEAEYLAANPDVAQAVREGRVSSGLWHYQNQGIKEGRAGNNMQNLYNDYKKKTSQAQPTEAQLRESSKRASDLQVNPLIEQLKRQREQDTLNLNNQTAEVNNNYADTATDLQKFFDASRQKATSSVFGRGLGRSGLLDKEIVGYDTEQANQLGKSDREKNMQLAKISDQLGLTQRQSGEQEQQLLARKTALEAQTYDELAKQARQEGNDNMARLYEMASGIASRNAADLQSQLEESWRQRDYDFKQQQANTDNEFKRQELALASQKASTPKEPKPPTATEQKYAIQNEAKAAIDTNLAKFRTPLDFVTQMQKNYGSNTAVVEQIQNMIARMYPDKHQVLPSWRR